MSPDSTPASCGKAEGEPAAAGGRRIPPVDIVEREDVCIVVMELPGTRREDIHVDVSNGILTVDAHVIHPPEIGREVHHLRERTYGHVKRSVALPIPVDASRASSMHLYGLLTITLPRAG